MAEPGRSLRLPSWLWPSSWWDALVVSDPQLERLRLGGRAALTTALAAAAVGGLSRATGQPLATMVGGVMLSMMASISVQDATEAEQKRTARWMALPVGAAVVAAALAPAGRLWGGLVFLAVVFAAVRARSSGARGTALGMVGFLAYFNARFFGITAAQVPAAVGAAAVGLGAMYVVRFGLLRDRPGRALERALGAYRRGLALLLGRLSDAVAAGQASGGATAAIRRALRRVNELAILVEAQLGPLDRRTLDVELAAEHAAGALRRRTQAGPLAASERGPIERALREARCELRGGAPGQAGEAIAALTDDAALADALRGLTQASLWSATPSQLRDEAAAAQALGAAVPAGASAAAGAGASGAGSGAEEAQAQARRQAIQATVACGLSMVVGQWLSPTRWYWAVIAAFVVFSRATTRGETLVRAWHRVAGTAAGGGLGLLVARLVHGHSRAEVALVFGLIFAGIYLMRVSYGWMVLAVSALVAILYDLLGALSPGLLSLRFDETIVGAALGALVASLLLPSRTLPKVRSCGADLLAGVADYLRAAPGPRGQGGLRARARSLDAGLSALRAAAEPLVGGVVRLDPSAARLVESATALVFLARQLATEAELRLPSAEARGAAAEACERLADRARSVADALSGGAPPERAAGPPLDPLWLDDRSLTAMHWLRRIDEVLRDVDEAARGLRPSPALAPRPAEA